MRRVVVVCLALTMLMSTLYVLKPKASNPAVYPRMGSPVVSIGDVFRHH